MCFFHPPQSNFFNSIVGGENGFRIFFLFSFLANCAADLYANKPLPPLPDARDFETSQEVQNLGEAAALALARENRPGSIATNSHEYDVPEAKEDPPQDEAAVLETEVIYESIDDGESSTFSSVDLDTSFDAENSYNEDDYIDCHAVETYLKYRSTF